MDLIGRKLPKDGGRAIRAFCELGAGEIAEAKAIAALGDYAGRLEKTNGELQQASLWLMQNGVANPNNAGAAAYSYMNLLGIVAMGLMWLRAARAAQAALDAGAADRSFFEARSEERRVGNVCVSTCGSRWSQSH